MTVWTDELTEQLTALFRQGLSCSKIASKIGGVTRNAVIGRLYRLGLRRGKMTARPTLNEYILSPKKRNAGRRKNDFICGGLPSRRTAPGASSCQPIPRSQDGPEPPSRPLVSLSELEPAMCRFPYGDPREPSFGFCGEPNDGSPYCPEHHRLCLLAIDKEAQA
jgi:GcrA cell cycle regulator